MNSVLEMALEALSSLEEYARGFGVSGVYLADEIEGNRLLEKACEAIAALKEAIKQQELPELEAMEYWLKCNPPAAGAGYAVCWQAACKWQREAIKNQGEPSAEVVVLGNSMRELKWLNTDGLKSGDLLYTSAPTIPQGWQLVPIEPTEEMFAAGNPFMEGLSSLGEAWEAMLSAAPKGEQS